MRGTDSAIDLLMDREREMSMIKHTYCRICEPLCGLQVTVETDEDGNEVITKVAPDKDHPASKGFACIKGTRYGGIHHDADRLNYPLKRVGERFERIGWRQAIKEIGEKTKALKRKHGPRTLAHYMGNPSFFDFGTTVCLPDFMQLLGSPNVYCSHSIDANNKLAVSKAMYGTPMLMPIPDLAHCRFLICLGSNPAVSKMSAISVADPVRRLRDMERRGGSVIFVDPRKTETVEKVGRHLAIVPGTDVFLLLALLHVMAHEIGFTNDQTRKARDHGTGLSKFIDVARNWAPARVEPLTGIPASDIRQLAKAYYHADGAALYMSTGLNMGPFGSLCFWLVQGINLISGNLDRTGGMIVRQGPHDWLSAAFDHEARQQRETGSDRTLAQGWGKVAGFFPTASLPDEILSPHPAHIRALFISGGNPCHSTPHHQWHEAMSSLELVVSVDIYMNETAAAYADYILPTVDMFERPDLPLLVLPYQNTPHAQYTEAVVSPKFERKPSWEIFSELLMVCGGRLSAKPLCLLAWANRLMSKLPMVNKRITPFAFAALALRKSKTAPMKKLKTVPHGIPLPADDAGNFFRQLWPSDRKIDLFPNSIVEDLPRLECYEKEMLVAPKSGSPPLYLIGKRERRTHNSWMHFNPAIHHPAENKVYLHPDDAHQRNIDENDPVWISTDAGKICLRAQITKTVSPGVVAVPHGWGHPRVQSKHAAALGGDNINKVMSPQMDPVSGQAILIAQKVDVSRADEHHR
jgi:anaerobic selenocysteine-containing dehydrogenase